MINKKFIAGFTALGLSLAVSSVGLSEKAHAWNTHQEQHYNHYENNNYSYDQRTYQVIQLGVHDPVVIRVAGYGTGGKTDTKINTNQKEFMAMRASKLDAYRNLAERVYGIRVQGNTSVHNMAARDDNIRGYIDNLVRGAKVISTRELGNGSYETKMELVLEPRFHQCLVRGNAIYADPSCAQYTIHGEHPSQRLPIHAPRQPYPNYLQPRRIQIIPVEIESEGHYYNRQRSNAYYIN